MGVVVSFFRSRWEAHKRARHVKEIDAIVGGAADEEAVCRTKIDTLQNMINNNLRMQEVEMQRHVLEGREPRDSELRAYEAYESQNKEHERDIQTEQATLQSFVSMRTLAVKTRNENSPATIKLNKIAMRLDKINAKPLEKARELSKLNLKTAQIVTKQREAHAIVESDESAQELADAFSQNHHEEAEELAQLEAELAPKTPRVDVFASTRAKFARASTQSIELSLLAIAPAAPGKTKTKAGSVYTQLPEQKHDEGILDM